MEFFASAICFAGAGILIFSLGILFERRKTALTSVSHAKSQKEQSPMWLFPTAPEENEESLEDF
jgi:hypothetical protein